LWRVSPGSITASLDAEKSCQCLTNMCLRIGPAAPDEILPRLDLSRGVIHLQLPLLPLGLGSEPFGQEVEKTSHLCRKQRAGRIERSRIVSSRERQLVSNGTRRPARMSAPTAKLGHKIRPCPATPSESKSCGLFEVNGPLTWTVSVPFPAEAQIASKASMGYVGFPNCAWPMIRVDMVRSGPHLRIWPPAEVVASPHAPTEDPLQHLAPAGLGQS
jgi:hypothetical protein